jgi:hypothetical protein
MSSINIGRLQRVPLREVWLHEARDFTTWLQENLEILNEALDLNLLSAVRERPAGDFSVDLVAEDDNGGTVVIENQLEKSNHDHLGKLITYLAAIGAKTAIWIVSDPRPEHVQAVAWLNEASGANFYMVKVEAVRIGESPAAPLFTEIVGPSEEAKEVGQTKQDIAERDLIYKRWWSQLIARSETVLKLHAHITPGTHNWISAGAGTRGIYFNYSVKQTEWSIELYIDRGKNADAENKAIFEQLAANRKPIEASFGHPLSWISDNKRACRIRYTSDRGGIRTPEEEWPELQDEIVHAMDRLEKAIRPYLNQLRFNSSDNELLNQL